MTMSRAHLGLLTFVLVLLSARLSLCSRAKLSSASASASAENLMEELSAPASLVSQSSKDHTLVGDSTLMGKAGSANSMVAGFFRSRFPFPGWPFPKYPPVPLVKPALPSVPTTPGAENSEKLPSSPSTGKGNGAGGNP